jgi:hypothetical protein
MPLLRYFMVVGSVLVGLLFWVGNETEPNSSPVKTSQVVGVPKPFKAARTEPMPDLTTVNFAAEYERPQTKPLETLESAAEHKRSQTKPVKTVDAKRKETTTNKYPQAPTWSRLVEYPHDNLSIH